MDTFYLVKNVLYTLVPLFIMSLLYRRNTIPLKCYLLMFALPIFILACIPEFWSVVQKLSSDKDILQFVCAFTIIIDITIAFLYIFSQLFLSHPPRWIPFIIIKAISNCLFILSVGVIIFLIYTQLYSSLFENSGNNSGSSGSDLAICTAIIAAFATIYNVQRVSKQELTKNRQDWITDVRLETAKIISAFDMFKYALLNGAKRDEIKSNCKSLLESCNKVRMFINPADTIAPMITAQLDAIINYCNSWLKDPTTIQYCLKKPTTAQSINIKEVNLHKSLMPWVLVLLKVEWERVKDVLESREEKYERFYSEDVYAYEWGKKKLEKYGIKVKDPQKDINDIIKDLFPGFEFYGKDKEDITKKIEELKFVDKKENITKKMKKWINLCRSLPNKHNY